MLVTFGYSDGGFGGLDCVLVAGGNGWWRWLVVDGLLTLVRCSAV